MSSALRSFAIMIEIEVDKAIAELKDTLGRLKPEVMNDVIAKSLNSAMKKARQAAYAEINRVYNIRAMSDVTSKLKGEPARPGKLEARLWADRRGIQLAYFAPQQETSGKKRLSIEVRRGQRKTLKSAFWAKGNGGVQTIFARGEYKGREFNFRSKRLVKYPNPDSPIGLLRTTSPLDMLKDKDVVDRINQEVDAALLKNMEARIRRILRKQSQGGDV
jgi:hypothetical protein